MCIRDRSDPAEAEKHQEPAKEPKAEKTPEERRRAFGEMVQGEYSDVFQEMMQRAIDKATENIRQNPQVARLTQALANAYGVDTDDMDGLIEAVENGRVKDEKYYEDLAQQRGVSVKTARELDKMESDLKRSNTRNAQLQAMQQEATRQQRVSQIQAQWEAQAAQLKTQYPDFELQEVLANEQVADLMRRGVSLPDAYRAAYFDHIMQQATAQTAQKVEQGVAARIARLVANGAKPSDCAILTRINAQQPVFGAALRAARLKYRVRKDSGWQSSALADDAASKRALLEAMGLDATGLAANDDPGVTISTIHASKGLEFKHVFLIGCSEGLLPYGSPETGDALEEERRLMYVGITRAEDSLHLSYARTKDGYGAQHRRPSRFL